MFTREEFSYSYDDKIDEVVEILAAAENLLFVTGAGISAESGLPTYRGIGGLYNGKLTRDDIPIEVALSGEIMSINPGLTWTYISEIEKACRGATYNAAHQLIVEMEMRFSRVMVLTQNIDGFHKDAGSANVIDIHGDIRQLYCVRCSHRETVSNYAHLEIPPKCPQCNNLVRPDVVLFGEMLDPAKTARLSSELERGFDAVFSVGTTSVFPYISGPVLDARMKGVPTVEINPSTTEVSDFVAIKLAVGAVKALSDIWSRLNKR